MMSLVTWWRKVSVIMDVYSRSSWYCNQHCCFYVDIVVYLRWYQQHQLDDGGDGHIHRNSLAKLSIPSTATLMQNALWPCCTQNHTGIAHSLKSGNVADAGVDLLQERVKMRRFDPLEQLAMMICPNLETFYKNCRFSDWASYGGNGVS